MGPSVRKIKVSSFATSSERKVIKVWRKRWPRGDLITLYSYLKGSCSKVGVSLFKQVIGQEEMASSCTRGGLDWILGNISSPKNIKHWNSLPREVVESPSPVVFKRYVDVALNDMV